MLDRLILAAEIALKPLLAFAAVAAACGGAP